MTASSKSLALGKVLKRHGYQLSARAECTDMFGTGREPLIDQMLDAAQKAVAAGFLPGTKIPADLASHQRLSETYSDLCGFPDEALHSMKAMLADGHTVGYIANYFGWNPERISRFMGGDRRAYFDYR